MKRIATALAFTLLVSTFVVGQSSALRNDPAVVRKAIEKSLPLLESIRVPFIEKTGCVSCHHNSLPAMAVGLARERGFKSNERTSLEESEQILGIWNIGREKLLQGDGFGGAQAAAGYILVGLAANKQQPNKTTDAIVHYLIGRQIADGRWPVATNRPPSESSDIAVTALSLRALQLYAPKGLRQEVNNRVERAREWLAKAVPRNNGHNQWISAAASSWATMALVLTVEAPVNLTGIGIQ